jgi:F0F1-type ATP synthase assembly protein I
MKKTFAKNHDQTSEKLELTNDPKWFYIHYYKGSFQKATYILKSDPVSAREALEEFFNEYHVSEDIRKNVHTYLKADKDHSSNWQDFTNFLVQMLSLNILVGLTFALAIFGGFKLGSELDHNFQLYPLFTIIGVLGGMAMGGFAGYLLIYKHIHTKNNGEKKPVAVKNEAKSWPLIEATIDDVRKAIRIYSEQLPKGVYRTILVNEDNSIDFDQLASTMKGIPSRKFYMSKETYDIYEEADKEIPKIIDKVQKAVDSYKKENKEYPMLKYDPLNRVNYYQLIQSRCLDEQPPIDLYITNYDGLVTHIKPKKKSTGQ